MVDQNAGKAKTSRRDRPFNISIDVNGLDHDGTGHTKRPENEGDQQPDNRDNGDNDDDLDENVFNPS
jgi:hypothetical protein